MTFAVPQDHLVLAKLLAPFGIKGWVKALVYADPPEHLLKYPLQLFLPREQRPLVIEEMKAQGKIHILRIRGISDRTTASTLTHALLATPQDRLPALPEGSFYWKDLIGLRVFNQDELPLGTVDYLFETAGQTMLVMVEDKKQRIIPFVWQKTITQVDPAAGRLQVFWEHDF